MGSPRKRRGLRYKHNYMQQNIYYPTNGIGYDWNNTVPNHRTPVHEAFEEQWKSRVNVKVTSKEANNWIEAGRKTDTKFC